VFTVGFFIVTWVLVGRKPDDQLMGFITNPYANHQMSRKWIVPHRLGRKLWFALLTSAWTYSDPDASSKLAIVIFLSLVVLLVLQFWLRPYHDVRDNQLEVACILLLLYDYFVSLLPGATRSVEVTVTVFQSLLIAYVCTRVLGSRVRAAWNKCPCAVSRADRERKPNADVTSTAAPSPVPVPARSHQDPASCVSAVPSSDSVTRTFGVGFGFGDADAIVELEAPSTATEHEIPSTAGPMMFESSADTVASPSRSNDVLLLPESMQASAATSVPPMDASAPE
jgi:hypothetical protein